MHDAWESAAMAPWMVAMPSLVNKEGGDARVGWALGQSPSRPFLFSGLLVSLLIKTETTMEKFGLPKYFFLKNEGPGHLNSL